ncbi:GntP family permease [Mycolicibacterium smegmatis]|uniref:GntP family permease n=1 Tax=Mycolicibacterium smegmatis TaxID=1772 RepID=UPI0005DA18FF|nr:SLC13 family permease [Mycolicibacterium smegmatis]MDF1900051.1 SLC13 family permease [Mycolicibacterium smegmatis]MDF1906603.1 SLC13 family permease [Mycolicibacterium smegmatis]MDF1919016.1 SLC13 family permease [Mycolicibacterium smegmatis]MDF1924721.1 SLC13 family permease [Mycolicibacterium smegmatis]UAK54138.1 GntP family permease [Mycolicibacterium smegmatis]
MSETAIVINTAVAILAVVVMIVRFKFNPVVSLVVGSAYLGLAVGLGVEKTIEAITTGFGDIMAEVGLLIAFGVLMGAILQQTGAIQRLVETLLRWFGAKRMPYAMSLTIATALQSIFLDVLLVISAPLARNLAKRIGKNGTPRMAAAMAIGLECGIVLTVPGVGALALAGLLGVPLGKMLLFGLCLVIPTVAIAVAIMSFLFNHGWWDPARDEQPFLGDEPTLGSDGSEGPHDSATDATDATESDGSAPAAPASSGATATTVKAKRDTATQAPLLLLFGPMLASLVLIAAGAILDAAEIEIPAVKFISSPVIALLIGLIGTSFVGRRVQGGKAVEAAIATGFKESGQILILTGVGGSLAATIKAAGLGDILGEYFTASTAAPLLVVWVIAAALHVAVGSVTISAITSAGILAPVAPIIGLDPVLIALAAGAGSLFAVHVTSNTFWLLQSLMGQSTRGALKTVTVGVSVASVVAILLLLPASLLF